MVAVAVVVAAVLAVSYKSYNADYKNYILVEHLVSFVYMTFILKYLDYFSDKPESEPPIAPLPRLDISNIFGAEYDLYANLCESDIPLSDRLYIIKHYIDHAVYFQIKYLPDKMAAILVYLLRDKSQIELESLI